MFVSNRIESLTKIKGQEPNIGLRFEHRLKFMGYGNQCSRCGSGRAESELVRKNPVRAWLSDKRVKVPTYNHFLQDA